MNIPIFLATDNNFTVPTYVTLYSLISNYNGTNNVDVYVLTDNNFSTDNEDFLMKLSSNYFKINIIRIENEYDIVTPNLSFITRTTMYRLLIPRIVNQFNNPNLNKCIYLDSDIIVEGDITELYNIDVNGFYVAGVKDRAISNNRNDELRNILNVPSLANYVNAGVLLFNISEINKQGVVEKLELAGYRNDYPYNDQDAINAEFYGKIKNIPLRYNAINIYLYDNKSDTYEQYGMDNLVEARKSPLIIHYISDKKPWIYKNTPLAEAWWKYVYMQDKKEKQIIFQFVKARKIPFKSIMKTKGLKLMRFLHILQLALRIKHCFR
ncbi:MAG: glycosyltransferase family 8 protein [Clostridiales bacterium]|nr:glycosyltransferase family 8 protein [Clostridiales bacterium]